MEPDPAAPVDSLPADLDVTVATGVTPFPDNSRRRVPGVLYLVAAAGCIALWAARGEGVLVNRGILAAGVALALVGAYHLQAGWSLKVKEVDALAAAAKEVGFPIGHASAQLGWRGLRSRPTWRILVYSAEEPPLQRGIVLVDAVTAEVVQHFVETNPEDWGTAADDGAPADA